MKKIILILLIIISLSLCSCSAIMSDNIQTLKSWSFQYNEGTNDYSLFFGLLNDKGKFVSADTDVDIRIEDDAGNELYRATKTVTKRDFGNYTSEAAGEEFLARVRIKKSEIAAGLSPSGKVYFKVYKNNIFQFDEVNCKAFSCLPTKKATLKIPGLPAEVVIKGFDGKTDSIIRIEDFSYSYDDSVTPVLKVTLEGTKIHGSGNSIYDTITYKLFDSAGYLVDSNSIFLNDMDPGDKFKDNSITLRKITPGEEYTLKFYE